MRRAAVLAARFFFCAGKDVSRPHYRCRIETALGSEVEKQRFVRNQIIKDPRQEARRRRGGAEALGPDTGDREEASEPFRLGREKGKRLYRKGFRVLTCNLTSAASLQSYYPFRKDYDLKF
jgi:hypothetical protein